MKGAEHYEEIKDASGMEPIDIMEAAACLDIPQEYHQVARRNLNVAQALKYLLRLGAKDTADSELRKAENYIHRARTGGWPHWG